MTTSVRQWSRALHMHCTNTESRQSEDKQQEELLNYLNDQVWREAQERSGASGPTWTWAVTLQARAALSRNKSTGRSSISVDVLQPLFSTVHTTSCRNKCNTAGIPS